MARTNGRANEGVPRGPRGPKKKCNGLSELKYLVNTAISKDRECPLMDVHDWEIEAFVPVQWFQLRIKLCPDQDIIIRLDKRSLAPIDFWISVQSNDDIVAMLAHLSYGS